MLKGQIVVKVTSANSKMNTIQTESKDFSTAETASYLFLALMATYGINEKEAEKVFDTLEASIHEVQAARKNK